MGKVAYGLRADVEDFSGGSASLPNGELFDVGEALKDGGGKIVLDPAPREIKGDSEKAQNARAEEAERAHGDEVLIDTLERHPALKRVAVSADTAPPKSDEKKED